jgi:Domain of unknown function (DUF1844)
MSDTPKFEVIDRRKFKADEEHESQKAAQEAQAALETQAAMEKKPAPEPVSAPSSGPRLVVNEGRNVAEIAPPDAQEPPLADEAGNQMPPPPTAEESHEQKAAYEASAQRLEEIIRAQNPAVGAQPPITFENLVQQFYVSAMIQMGAGAQEGQRPRVDILGARTTIDLLGVLEQKTKGNLTPAEDRALQTVLFEVRMAFMELTSMINLQAMQPPQPPPPGKR